MAQKCQKIIIAYNATKRDIDNMDHMTENYSVARTSRYIKYLSTIQLLTKEIKTQLVKYGHNVRAADEFQRFLQSVRC